MTITQDTSAPLFAVVGSTGVQGGAVIRALNASSKPYRVRAITRDITKPTAVALASLGCELVSADISTPEGAEKAFQGADLGFAMTASDYTLPETISSKDKEFNEGKSQIDAAKAGGVKTLVWAGLPNLGQLSGGKIHVDHFDVKAELTSYARSLNCMKIIDVQPGSYFSNYLTWFGPRKQPDGSFVLSLALNPESKIPLVDMVADYGRYAVDALEKGGIETVHTAKEYITPSQMAEEFSKASGKQVTFSQLPDEQLYGILKNFQGEIAATHLLVMFQAFRDVGYYGGADLAKSNAILSTPARTFGEMLAANKESVAKLFA